MQGRGHTSGRLITLACLVLSGGASAQATVLRESIEWAVADSDVVVRGRLAGVTREGPVDEIGWATVDVEVLETIKGPAAARVSVRCSLPDGRMGIEGWEAAGGAERLVFLVNSGRRTRDREEYARHPLALREDGWTLVPRTASGPRTTGGAVPPAGAAPPGTRRGPGVAAPPATRTTPRVAAAGEAANPALSYDIDFRPLQDAAQALAGARKAAREEPAVGPGGRAAVLVEAPAGVEALRDFPAGTRFVLKAPLDARIEVIAQAWATDPSRRHAARPVLQRLKSGRNAELLKTYLDDPYYVRGTTMGKAATWHHFDRLSAYEKLRDWGVDVPKPEVDLPVDAYRPARPLAERAVAGLVLLTLAAAAGLFTLRRRRAARRTRRGTPVPAPRFLPSLFDAVALALLLLAVTSALLWRRGWTTVDEITFSTATGRHWLSSFRGRLQWVKIAGWEGRVAPAFASFNLAACPPEPWTHDGVSVTSSANRHGFSRLDGTVLYRGRAFGKPLNYAAREAPAWVPAALLAVVPLVRGVFLLAGAVRRRLRCKRRQCPGCGYDLRATRGRCPECGEDVIVSAAAAKVAT